MNQLRQATHSMILAAAIVAAPSLGSAQASPAPTKTGRVMANGVNYYYEIHGKGDPLLLLHGGLGSIDMFGPILPMLAKNRQVIAVDLHGHGRTELGNRPIDLIDIGNDLAVVLKHLGYGAVDVMGYSFVRAQRFALQFSIPNMCVASHSCQADTPAMDSIPKCCRNRQVWEPGWPK